MAANPFEQSLALDSGDRRSLGSGASVPLPPPLSATDDAPAFALGDEEDDDDDRPPLNAAFVDQHRPLPTISTSTALSSPGLAAVDQQPINGRITMDAVAKRLLSENLVLTALELHTELTEGGRELKRLRDYFSNPANFEPMMSTAGGGGLRTFLWQNYTVSLRFI